MSYSQPTADVSTAQYTARFFHVNGTQVLVTFYDPAVMGPTDFTDDDFQSAVDALANATGWTFATGSKSYGTKQNVNPT